jgi:hypothetical protein
VCGVFSHGVKKPQGRDAQDPMASKDLRATFGTRLAEAGCAFMIAHLLVHSDVRVTIRYVRMVEDSKQVAVEAMKLTVATVRPSFPGETLNATLSATGRPARSRLAASADGSSFTVKSSTCLTLLTLSATTPT